MSKITEDLKIIKLEKTQYSLIIYLMGIIIASFSEDKQGEKKTSRSICFVLSLSSDPITYVR